MSQGTAVTVNNINLVSLSGDITGSTIDGYVSSISGTSPVIITPNSLQWVSSVTSPTLTQASSANQGQTLTIQAQGTGGSSTGGNLILASGSSLSGSAGNIIFQLGATTGLTLLPSGTLQFPATATATINQAASTGSGANLSITAQSAGSVGDNGGSLILTSGASTTTGTSGNVTINTGTPGAGGTAGNIQFQVSGTTQAFVNSSGLGIGSTPGTSPTISSGSGVPSSTQPTGSIYLNTNGSSNTGIYTRYSNIWSSSVAYTGLTAPVSFTTNTNTSSPYVVDVTVGNDAVILHSHSGAPTTYVMPAPTVGRQVIIRDITGTIETTNQTGGYITGTASTSNVIFVAPHAAESFNTSSGYSLTGTVTNSASTTVTGSSTLFTKELAPGMSITFSNQSGVSYIVSSITNDTSLTLTTAFTGTGSSGNTAKMNSLAYYANWGTLTLFSDGTNWFASSNKPLRVYLTANGTFIPSPGCTAAYLVGCGGGGGGGGGTTNQAGGGGGGATQSTMTVNLTPNISGGYVVTIGAGGTAGSTGAAGGAGGTTSFGTTSIANFYGASGGGAGSTANQYAAGGLSFNTGISGNLNIYSSSNSTGNGTAAIGSGTTITSANITGSTAMGGYGGNSGGSSGGTGMTNISATLTSYTGGTGGTGTNGSGGGGAGPQGNGATGTTNGNPGNTPNANSGAGGSGGGGGATTGGAGGSGYLYVYTWM
jgi:hypothetical protein